jgi:hypothetical protein
MELELIFKNSIQFQFLINVRISPQVQFQFFFMIEKGAIPT